MTETKAPEWPTASLLAQFRPEPGWVVDKACFGSYSADIRVVVAALLAVAGASDTPEQGTAVHLAQAIRDLRKRVCFVVQRGRLHWPRNLPQVSGLLDRFVFEADYDERGPTGRSWHPKFAAIRWRRQKGSETAWRVWIGSRNLTRDLSLDCGLLLSEVVGRGAGVDAGPGMVNAVSALLKWVPDAYRVFAPHDLRSLAKARWALPPGADDLSIHWLDGEQDSFPVMQEKADEVLVLSPFVDGSAMHRVSRWMKEKARPKLMAGQMDLQRECQRDSSLTKRLLLHVKNVVAEEGAPYEPPAEVGQDLGNDRSAEQEIDRSDEVGGLHAKVIYARAGKVKRLWLGSPNLSSRAWSRNVEIVAHLSSHSKRDSWGPVIHNLFEHATIFEPSPVEVAEDDEERDALEQARKELAATFLCDQVRKGEEVHVIARQAVRLGLDIELSVGLPWQGFERVPWLKNARQVSLGSLPLAACSELLLFFLSSGEAEIGWLMRVPFRPELDDMRDRATLTDYLGPRGYLDLIRAELAPEAGFSSALWDQQWPSAVPQVSGRWGSESAATLESLMRLFLRDPERLATIGRTVEMLEDEVARCGVSKSEIDEDIRREIVSFQYLWKQVGEYLSAAGNSGS